MSYEFRSDSKTLDLPNPYAVENRVRFGLAAATGGLGVALLFVVRDRLSAGWNSSAILAMAAAIALVGHAVATTSKGLGQLRFYFGRDRPTGLAHERPGGSPDSEHLIDTVRRGALQFEEPVGPLNGLLYSLQRNLIFAPVELQNVAQTHFRTAMVIAGIAVSLLLASILLGGSQDARWLGLLYLGLAGFVLRPAKPVAAAGSQQLPVVLIVLAVLGPVALTLVAPSLPRPPPIDLRLATLCTLVLSGFSAAIIFLAVRSQLAGPPTISTAHHQMAASWSGHPAQLVDELARRLQAGWREQIPNRCYRLERPGINAQSAAGGTFDCLVLEETQPFPARQPPPRGLGECLRDEQYRFTLCLQLYGAALTLVAAVLVAGAAFHYTVPRLMDDEWGAATVLFYALICYWIGRYCLRGAHALFGRFDYESLLYLFECSGSWNRSNLQAGNVLTGQIKTEKSLVTVDNATLTVWIVEVRSVTFGKDGRRSVYAMVGRKDEAQALAESLAAFAQDLSLVIAPTSEQDLRKVASIAAVSSGMILPRLPGTSPLAPLAVSEAAALSVGASERDKK